MSQSRFAAVVVVATVASISCARKITTEPLWVGMDLYGASGNGTWSSPSSVVAVEQIRDSTGSNTIAIVPSWCQYEINSTSIESIPQKSFGMADIASAAAAFQRSFPDGSGRVILKPHVDCLCGTWRAKIGTEFTAEWQWDQWFASYTAYMTGMASIAAELQLDGLVIGTEMIGTSGRESDWRGVVAACRKAFPGGTLIYGANWGDEPWQVQWWDAVDVIGVDAYYPLADRPDPPLSELLASWPPVLANLSALASRWGKPVLFTEVGYRSYAGAAVEPGVYQGNSPPDQQAQARLYQALAGAVLGVGGASARPSWLRGALLWSWSDDPLQGGPCDDGYSPHRKAAEPVIRQAFSAVAAAAAQPEAALLEAPSSPSSSPLSALAPASSVSPSALGLPSSSKSPSPSQLLAPKSTSVYADGSLDTGWQSWSYNGQFQQDDTTSPTLPGHSASFRASAVVPFGGVSLRGVLPPGAPTQGLNVSALLAANASVRFHVRAAEPNATLTVSLCYCDDCGLCNVSGSSRAINEYLPGSQQCYVPTAWSAPAQAAAALVTVPVDAIVPLVPAGTGPRIPAEAIIRRIGITNGNYSANVSFWVDDVQIVVPQPE